MKIAAVIPVKTFSNAKTRLQLPSGKVEALCKIMLEEILQVLSISPKIEEIIMITKEEKAIEFYNVLGESFEAIEDAVIEAMQSTERTSSMVENLNGRIRPYFNFRQEIGYGYLDLLRFYLNHIEFSRSEREHRIKKSPTEILTEKKHSHWLELLGFDLFKRAA